MQTKLALNSKLTSNKFSTVEKTVNVYLVAYLVLLCSSAAFCTLMRYNYIDDLAVSKPWYLYSINVLSFSKVSCEIQIVSI